MTDTSQVLQFLERAAARADGRDDADPPPEAETLRYTRDRLREAAQFAHAGAEVPAGARLRPVKQAMVAAVRPVTSNQRAFNDGLLAAVDGLAATADRLAHQLVLHDQRTARLQAGVATTDLTIDDLNDDVRRLGDQVDGLTAALEGLRAELAAVRTAELAALRSDLAVVQARQDVVLRAAREALAGGGSEALAPLDAALTEGRAALRSQLADALRGPRDHVKARVAAYLADVEATPGSGPLVDLAPGRGEWLEALRDAGVEAHGVDADPATAEQAAARGLDVRTGDPLVHLQALPESSVRAVTAFRLADRLPLDSLVAVVDAALVALAPGGLLLIDAPNPTNLAVGAADVWLDPGALRPVHPRLVELLVLARGFAAAEVRFGPDPEVPTLHVDDLVTADDDPARVGALVERLNAALAGPTDFAVLARKALPAG